MAIPAPPPDQIGAQLAQALARSGHVPPQADWQRMGGGRTNHSWKVTHSDICHVVKLYASDDRNPLFPNDPSQEAAILAHLSGTGLAPELVDTTQTRLGTVLIYAHLPGATWQAGAADVARLFHRLHHIRPPVSLRHAPDGSAALKRQTLAILDQCHSAQAQELAAICPAAEVPPSGRSVLLHADPVPGNIIDTGSALCLIDWQCPAIGDPCEDIAIFLSPAMQLAYRGKTLDSGEVEAFLAAYSDPEIVSRYRALAPWFHWRMAAYCLWKHEQIQDANTGADQADSAYLIAEKRFLS